MSDRRDNTRVAVAFVGSILAGGAGAFACGGGDEDARAGSSEDASAENAAATDDASPEGAPATDPADGGTWLADGALPGAKEACEAYLQAGCDRQAECDVRRPCETFAEYCPAVLFGEGSSRTVAGTLACAQARRTQSCDEVKLGIALPCETAGSRKGGDPCTFGTQCGSLRCSGFFGACGACYTVKAPDGGCPGMMETCPINQQCKDAAVGCEAIAVPPRSPVGAACVADAGADTVTCSTDTPCAASAPLATMGSCSVLPSSGSCLFRVGQPTASLCAPGTTCLRIDPGLPEGECVPAGGKDALCGNAYGRRPCADGFFCTDSRSGTCQPLHKLGEDCQTTTQCEETLYCERSSGLGSCVARVGLGASCGTTTVDGGASYSVLCESGATCGRILDDAGAYAYRCVRVGSLGSACGGSPYEKCAGALSCVGNVCALTDCPRDAGPG